MAKYKLELGREELTVLLNGEWEYTDPPLILKGLSADDACKPVAGLPYTIAELVRHMHYWQQEVLEIARGVDKPRDPEFKFGVTDFGKVEPAEWEALRDAFLGSYEELLKCAENPELMSREPDEHRNVGFLLANHTLHNAYHFGQIVLLRRLMGNWVPMHPGAQ